MKLPSSRLLVKISFLLFLLILGALVLGGRENLATLVHFRNVKTTLIKEALALVEENKRLTQEKKALHGPEYLERLSRESLGLVRPGETIYVVEERNPLSVSPDRN